MQEVKDPLKLGERKGGVCVKIATDTFWFYGKVYLLTTGLAILERSASSAFVSSSFS